MEKSLKQLVIGFYIILCLIIFITLGTYFLIFTRNKNNNYDVSMMKEISIDEALSKIEKKEKTVIFIGRNTCAFCVNFVPNMAKAQVEKEFITMYINLLDVDTKSDSYEQFLEKLDKKIIDGEEEVIFKDEFGSTPMIIIFEDGKMVDGFVGYKSYKELITFLEDNGFN